MYAYQSFAAIVCRDVTLCVCVKSGREHPRAISGTDNTGCSESSAAAFPRRPVQRNRVRGVRRMLQPNGRGRHVVRNSRDGIEGWVSADRRPAGLPQQRKATPRKQMASMVGTRRGCIMKTLSPRQLLQGIGSAVVSS
jgi:hypothetical protein